MFKKKSLDSGQLQGLQYDTTIAPGMIVSGDLNCSGAVFFNAKLNGNLKGESNPAKKDILVVGPDAKIVGNVNAAEVYILGTIKGNVISSGIVYLMPGCLIQGDINYNEVEMNHGAKVEGKFNHLPNSSLGLKS